jgi:hypothetical protein
VPVAAAFTDAASRLATGADRCAGASSMVMRQAPRAALQFQLSYPKTCLLLELFTSTCWTQ